MAAVRTTEPARGDRARHVPRLVIPLRCRVPDHAAAQSRVLVLFERERERVNLATRWALGAPLLLIALPKARVLDVAGLQVHDRRLARVVNLRPPDFLEARDAGDGVAVGLLPFWEPNLVIYFVADRLRLLAGNVRRIEDEKEAAEINLRRRPVRPDARQHRGDRLARFEDRVQPALGMPINHLVRLHRPRDRPRVVRDQPRNPDVSDERAADLHRLAEVNAAHEWILQRVEDRNEPRRDADIERSRRRVAFGKDDVLPRPLVNWRAVGLRETQLGEQIVGGCHAVHFFDLRSGHSAGGGVVPCSLSRAIRPKYGSAFGILGCLHHDHIFSPSGVSS